MPIKSIILTKQKVQKGTYELGLKTGIWLNFYENNQLYSIGAYFSNEKSGIWKYFTEKGAINYEGFFEHDLKTGQWIYYYINGSLESIGSYLNDEKDRLWGFFYPNDQLKQEQTWRQGKLLEVSDYYSIKGEHYCIQRKAEKWQWYLF